MTNLTIEESLDQVHALNIALCFLCHINADYKEVEIFLIDYPDALLFEGTEADSCAREIVEDQMHHCQCFHSDCNENRKRVLRVLGKGFDYYRAKMRRHNFSFGFQVNITAQQILTHQMRAVQHELRDLRKQSMEIQHQILDTSVDVKSSQFELEMLLRQESMNKTARKIFTCRRSSDILTQRSLLENRLGVSTCNLSTLEKEQMLLAMEMKTTQKMQASLLKSAFSGCRRHVCSASQIDLDYENE